jgi:hypothetical protein
MRALRCYCVCCQLGGAHQLFSYPAYSCSSLPLMCIFSHTRPRSRAFLVSCFLGLVFSLVSCFLGLVFFLVSCFLGLVFSWSPAFLVSCFLGLLLSWSLVFLFLGLLLSWSRVFLGLLLFWSLVFLGLLHFWSLVFLGLVLSSSRAFLDFLFSSVNHFKKFRRRDLHEITHNLKLPRRRAARRHTKGCSTAILIKIR